MGYKTTINGATLELHLNKLYDVQCDAIVIPSNNRLLPTGALRCRILKRAGAMVQVECNRIINQISTVHVGDVVMTSGGDLPSQHILHVNNSSRDVKSLMNATWNAIKLADKKKIESIFFCALSKDVDVFSIQTCANIMIPTIKKYLSELNKNIRKVCICLETQEDYKAFEIVLRK